MRTEQCSAPAPVMLDIPQGFVLRPLFFLIFINDIVHNLTVKIRLYADCIIYHDIHNSSNQAVLKIAKALLRLQHDAQIGK